MANPTNRESGTPELTILHGDVAKGGQTALVLAVDANTHLDALIALLVEHWQLPTRSKKGLIGYDLYAAGQSSPMKPSTRLADLGELRSPLRLESIEGGIVMAEVVSEDVPKDLAAFSVFHPDNKQVITLVTIASRLTVRHLRDRLEQLWALPDLWDHELVYYEIWAQNRKLALDDPVAGQGISQGSILALVRQDGVDLELVGGEGHVELTTPEGMWPAGPIVVSSEGNRGGTEPGAEESGGSDNGKKKPPPVIWKYLDFELQTVGAGSSYEVEVVASPAGNARERFQPPDATKVENFVLRATRLRHGIRGVDSPQWDAAREFGQDLFERVFRGRVLACLIASQQAAEEQDCGLRLKLRLDKTPDLMSLPWEFLYDAQGRTFLASQEEKPIIRYINADKPIRPIVTKRPLRILAMAANPEAEGLEPVNADIEREKLQQALQPMIDRGAVAIDWVTGGSLDALFKHLFATHERHHIFHFVGHGGFDRSSSTGYLMLEGPKRSPDPITGERFGAVLKTGKRRFQLAVLNACEGARTGTQDPFASMATSLLLSCNLPAVVAMQFVITYQAAIVFAANFYGALATGRPVDTAVTTARLAILADQNDIEWGTPVLYMRSPDGNLFDFTAGDSVPGN